MSRRWNTTANRTCPLRRIVLTVLDDTWARDTLECGHVVASYVAPWGDGGRARRRRCPHCISRAIGGLEFSSMP